MAIKIEKEINRLPGLDPNGASVIAGQPVLFWTATSITVATSGLNSASYTIVGIAADSTATYGSVVLGSAGQNLGTVQFLDDYAKGGLVSAFVDGGIFEVWNDGRGAVFATDVINAGVGQALYVDSTGLWTATQGSANTIGYTKIASVIKAPTSASDSLRLSFVP